MSLKPRLRKPRIIVPQYERFPYSRPSDIIASGLAATAGLGQIVLSWSVSDPSHVLAAVEVWESSSNDLTNAVHVGDGSSVGFTRALPNTVDAGYYYWIRARDTSGDRGPYYPVSPTAGVGAILRGFATWVPTIVSTSGTLTSVDYVAHYTKIQHLVLYWIDILIGVNGTGAGAIRFSLPTESSWASGFPLGLLHNGSAVCNGKALVANKTIVGSQVALDSEHMDVTLYDGSYPGADGEILRLAGFYEAAII